MYLNSLWKRKCSTLHRDKEQNEMWPQSASVMLWLWLRCDCSLLQTFFGKLFSNGEKTRIRRMAGKIWFFFPNSTCFYVHRLFCTVISTLKSIHCHNAPSVRIHTWQTVQAMKKKIEISENNVCFVFFLVPWMTTCGLICSWFGILRDRIFICLRVVFPLVSLKEGICAIS